MHFVLAGGSGYIGGHLTKKLLSENMQVTILTHSDKSKITERMQRYYRLQSSDYILKTYEEYEGEGQILINLSGENLGSKAINSRRMKGLISSRNEVLCALESLEKLPPVFMQAAAVACYPDSAEEQDESSPTISEGDFPALISMLESRADSISAKFGCERCIKLRFGIVMSRDGGFMRKVAAGMPFTIMHAVNYLPFISLEDAINAIFHIAVNGNGSGIFNLTSPEYATLNEVLSCCFKNSLLPPIPVMTGLLKLGDRRGALLRANQKIRPTALLNSGFKFTEPNLHSL